MKVWGQIATIKPSGTVERDLPSANIDFLYGSTFSDLLLLILTTLTNSNDFSSKSLFFENNKQNSLFEEFKHDKIQISTGLIQSKETRDFIDNDYMPYIDKIIAFLFVEFLKNIFAMNDIEVKVEKTIETSELFNIFINQKISENDIDQALRLVRKNIYQFLRESFEFQQRFNEKHYIDQSSIIDKNNRHIENLNNDGNFEFREKFIVDNYSLLSEESKQGIKITGNHIESTLYETVELKTKENYQYKDELNRNNISMLERDNSKKGRKFTQSDERFQLEVILRQSEETFKQFISKLSKENTKVEKDSIVRYFISNSKVNKSEDLTNFNSGRTVLIEEFERLPFNIKERFEIAIRSYSVHIKRELSKLWGLSRTLKGESPHTEVLPTHTGPLTQPLEEVVTHIMAHERVFHRVPVGEFLNFVKEFSAELLPSGERRANIQLEPPELGRLELEIKVVDHEVELKVRVEKPETYAQFQQDLAQLKNNFEELGLRLKDIQLSLGFSDDRSLAKGRKEEELMDSDSGRSRILYGVEGNTEEIPFNRLRGFYGFYRIV